MASEVQENATNYHQGKLDFGRKQKISKLRTLLELTVELARDHPDLPKSRILYKASKEFKKQQAE